jgi:hypothetical protein
VRPRRVVRGRRVTLRMTVRVAGRPARALVRIGARRLRADAAGHAHVRMRFAGRPGRRTVYATLRGARRATGTLRVVRGR